jgi:peptide/nickel transport system permease protein
MTTYIVKRLLQVPIMLIVVSAIIFFSLRLGPFDPEALLAQAGGDPARIADIRNQWGLDEPLPLQYVTYIGNVLGGNLGRGFFDGRPVSGVILERLPATVELTVLAMIIGAILGIGLGIVSALKPDSLLDVGARSLGLAGISLPGFWIGLMLISLFAVKLHWLPVGGRIDSLIDITSRTGFYVLDGILAGNFAAVRSALAHMILPAGVLGLFVAGFLARITRASMLETLGQEYIRTARAKGSSQRGIIVHHALRNALLPISTILGLQFGLLLGGAAVTETVFSYPGMGKLLIDAIKTDDFPQIQASILVLAAVYIMVNLIVDVLYVVIDPRLRSQEHQMG